MQYYSFKVEIKNIYIYTYLSKILRDERTIFKWHQGFSFIKEEKNKIRRKLIERLRLINELIPKNDLSSGKIERIYIFQSAMDAFQT